MSRKIRHPETPDLRARLHEIIFEADTFAGMAFDVGLLVAIVLAVIVVMLESVEGIDKLYHQELMAAEWFFTILFTLEYGVRIYAVKAPLRYATSFFGIVDLLAVLPTYLSILVPGSQSLAVVRTLRLVRVFRIFKLARYLKEAQALREVIYASRAKITVFLTVVLSIAMIMGATMHVVEGPESGFTSIPQGMYWAVVTMTTVGYGDIAPVTVLGKCLTTMLMILGYSIIVVPTGIFSAQMAMDGKIRASLSATINTVSCPSCGAEGHESDAAFCKACGAEL